MKDNLDVRTAKARKTKYLKEYTTLGTKLNKELYKLATRWGNGVFEGVKVNSTVAGNGTRLIVEYTYPSFGSNIELSIRTTPEGEVEVQYQMPSMRYVSTAKKEQMVNVKRAVMLMSKFMEHQDVVDKELERMVREYGTELRRVEGELSRIKYVFPQLFE